MLTGTLVTVAGFMPVGFAKSISGEYAGGIFWLVGVDLIASCFVAVVFTPYLGIVLLPKTMKAHGGEAHDPYAGALYQCLRRLLQWCMAHRVAVLVAAGVLFISAVAGMGLVQQQFFPTASRLEQMRQRDAQIVVKTANVADREAVRRRLLDVFAAEREFPELRGRARALNLARPSAFPCSSA